jgi:hypothetical protein
VAVRAALDGFQPSVWTALPGIVKSFDASKGTCEVQPAIKAQVTAKDGTKSWVAMPLCVDVPVQFMGGGAFVFTFPVNTGDEGLIIFASRCIDAWWQSGGVQQQAELRMHDLSDGMLIPGFRSQPRKLANINPNFPEWRSEDGLVAMTQTATGWKVTGTLEVSGNLLLNGNIKAPAGATYAGNIQTTGNVIAGFGGADQIGLQTHRHNSGANTPPTPGT